MGRRIAIGAAWGLAVAYAWQFVAAMYGLPPVGLVAAVVVATLVAATVPVRRGRPKDRREIYRPSEDSTAIGVPSISLADSSERRA